MFPSDLVNDNLYNFVCIQNILTCDAPCRWKSCYHPRSFEITPLSTPSVSSY